MSGRSRVGSTVCERSGQAGSPTTSRATATTGASTTAPPARRPVAAPTACRWPICSNQDALPQAERLVRKVASQYARGAATDQEVRLVGATDQCYLGGNDNRVLVIPMLSEASARAATLWDRSASTFDETSIPAGAKRLAGRLRASRTRTTDATSPVHASRCQPNARSDVATAHPARSSAASTATAPGGLVECTYTRPMSNRSPRCAARSSSSTTGRSVSSSPRS